MHACVTNIYNILVVSLLNYWVSESLQAQDEGIELTKQLEAELRGAEDQHSKDVHNYVVAALVSIHKLRILNPDNFFLLTNSFKRNIRNNITT